MDFIKRAKEVREKMFEHEIDIMDNQHIEHLEAKGMEILKDIRELLNEIVACRKNKEKTREVIDE